MPIDVDEVKKAQENTVLVLSAGAPNAPLAAGVLHEMLGQKIDFKRIYAAGGGVILALMYVAPAGISKKQAAEERIALRKESLASLAERLGIDDRIYKRLPLGYKAFVKQSPWFGAIQALFDNFKVAPLTPEQEARYPTLSRIKRRLHQSFPEDRRRLYNDLIDLAAVMLSPPAIWPPSERKLKLFPWLEIWKDLAGPNAGTGLCEPLPWLDELIDWEYLNDWDGELYIPAYHLTNSSKGEGETRARGTKVFCNRRAFEALEEKDEKGEPIAKKDTRGRALKNYRYGVITPDTVRAALAAPFIYPTKFLRGDQYNQADSDSPYVEGAYEDPYNEEIWLDDLRSKLAIKRSRDIDATRPQGLIRNVFVIDLLGTREMQMALLRRPETLWDAFGQHILTPIVAQSRTSRYKIGETIRETNDLIRFGIALRDRTRKENAEVRRVLEEVANDIVKQQFRVRFPEKPEELETRRVNLMPTLRFDIDKDRQRYVMDWSRSNMEYLFDRGAKAAAKYLNKDLTEKDVLSDLDVEGDKEFRRATMNDALYEKNELARSHSPDQKKFRALLPQS